VVEQYIVPTSILVDFVLRYINTIILWNAEM